MSRILRWLRSLNRVQYDYTDPYDLQRARGVTRMAWGKVIIGRAFLLLSLPGGNLVGVRATVFTALVVFAAIGMLGVIVLINRGNLVPASLIYILVLYVCVTVSYMYSPDTTFLISFTIPVVAAGVILKPRRMGGMNPLLLPALVMTATLLAAHVLPIAPNT